MPSKPELERALEDRCVTKVEAAGGLALKLSIPGVRGFPDRGCFLPGAKIFFIETKRIKSGRISAAQHRWRVLLHQLGFGFYFIETDAQFDTAMKKELSVETLPR